MSYLRTSISQNKRQCYLVSLNSLYTASVVHSDEIKLSQGTEAIKTPTVAICRVMPNPHDKKHLLQRVIKCSVLKGCTSIDLTPKILFAVITLAGEILVRTSELTYKLDMICEALLGESILLVYSKN